MRKTLGLNAGFDLPQLAGHGLAGYPAMYRRVERRGRNATDLPRVGCVLGDEMYKLDVCPTKKKVCSFTSLNTNLSGTNLNCHLRIGSLTGTCHQSRFAPPSSRQPLPNRRKEADSTCR